MNYHFPANFCWVVASYAFPMAGAVHKGGKPNQKGMKNNMVG